jgi:hypothetical protein
VKNLQLLNHALRMRWRWMALSEVDKPWQGLQFQTATEAKEMFQTCTKLEVGDGKKIAFWTDRWIDDSSVEQLAPNHWQFVQNTAKKWKLDEALQESRWVMAIRGAPSIPAVVEFLELWERLSTIQLHNVEDRVTWKLCNNGAYTSKSAYQAFFSGRTREMAASQLWPAGALLLHKLHMWFLLKDRLWTADRLARRGLEHPMECTLCCQEPETADHITLQCSFARQVWYNTLLQYRLHGFTPNRNSVTALWWTDLSEAVPRKKRKEINALVILVARSIWLERNSRVFD